MLTFNGAIRDRVDSRTEAVRAIEGKLEVHKSQ